MQTHDHVVLKCLSMDRGHLWRCKSGLTSSMNRASILQARAGFRCSQMAARRSSSASIAFLVGPLVPSDDAGCSMHQKVGTFVSVLRSFDEVGDSAVLVHYRG